jgi:hypothetical protein
MTSYFISPPEDTDWSLPSEEFEARLRQRWQQFLECIAAA